MAYTESTTDRGSRLFVSTSQPGATPSQILAVDVSSRRWRPSQPCPGINICIASSGTGPPVCRRRHGGGPARRPSDCLHAFNEAIRVVGQFLASDAASAWQRRRASLATSCSSSVVSISRNLRKVSLRTLQIYDIAARTWRVGTPLPEAHNCLRCRPRRKLFVVSARRGANISVYEPQSNSWTEEPGFPTEMGQAVKAFAHDGRLSFRARLEPRSGEPRTV